MSAFMSENPQPGRKKALNKCVHRPEACSCSSRGNILRGNKFVGQVEDGGQGGDITGDIAESSQARSLETMFGNGFVEVIDAKIGG